MTTRSRRGPKSRVHPALQFAHDRHVDEARSEAALLRDLHGLAKVLSPFEPQAPPGRRVGDVPADLQGATIVGKRSVFEGVGRELMENQTECQRFAGGQHDARPGRLVVHVGPPDDRNQLGLEDLLEERPGPLRFGEQVVSLRHGAEAGVEARLEIAERAGVPRRLSRDRLNAGDDVLDPMLHLPEKKVLLLAGGAQEFRFPFRRLLGVALLPRQVGERAGEEQAEKPEIGKVGGGRFAPELGLRPEAEGPETAADGQHLVGMRRVAEAGLVAGPKEHPSVHRGALEDLDRDRCRAEGPESCAEEIAGAEGRVDESRHGRRAARAGSADGLEDEEAGLGSIRVQLLLERDDAAHCLFGARGGARHGFLADRLAQHVESEHRPVSDVERFDIHDRKIVALGGVRRPDMEIAAVEDGKFLFGRRNGLLRHPVDEAEALHAAIPLAQMESLDIAAEGIEWRRRRGGLDEGVGSAQQRELRLNLRLDARIEAVGLLREPQVVRALGGSVQRLQDDGDDRDPDDERDPGSRGR